jgi:RHS repeat-associated protein
VALYFAYDGWNLIGEYDGSGTELARYVHGVRVDELLCRISPSGTVYYHQDGNNNVVALTDATGNVVERYTYDVFGAPTITDGSGNVLATSASGNRYLFTGREYVFQLGLYDYRNRVYSPSLGRFLQTDPIRFNGGDWNIYRYVGNNPTGFVDGFGLQNACFGSAANADLLNSLIYDSPAEIQAAKDAAQTQNDAARDMYTNALIKTPLGAGKGFAEGEAADLVKTFVSDQVKDFIKNSIIDAILRRLNPNADGGGSNNPFGPGHAYPIPHNNPPGPGPSTDPGSPYGDGFDPNFDPSNPFDPQPLTLENSRCPDQ